MKKDTKKYLKFEDLISKCKIECMVPDIMANTIHESKKMGVVTISNTEDYSVPLSLYQPYVYYLFQGQQH